MTAPRGLADAVEAIPALRSAGVADATLAAAYGVSRQAIHARFGPRPDVPLLAPPPAPATAPAPLKGDAGARLPAALLRWRRRRDLSQAEAAAALGVHVSTWAGWESGTMGCGVPAILLRLLDLLDRHEK